MAEKMAVTVFTGCIDRLTGLAILASAATAMDMEVEMFLQLWAVYAFKKDVMKKNTKFSEFQEMTEAAVKRLQELKLPMWYELLAEAKESGKLKIYACSTACQIWNVTKDDLELVDEIIGAGEWIEKSKEAAITLFV